MTARSESHSSPRRCESCNSPDTGRPDRYPDSPVQGRWQASDL